MKRLEVKERLKKCEPYLFRIVDTYDGRLWDESEEWDTLIPANLAESLLEVHFERGHLICEGLRGQVCKE